VRYELIPYIKQITFRLLKVKMPITVAAGLRYGSAAARFLGLRVQIPPEALMSLVSIVCCQVEISATGRSLDQKSSTDCGVSECD
jgi:hypothetical protein